MEDNQGLSSSPYISLTTYRPPKTKHIFEASKLPVSCIVQPFLPEESLPLAIFHTDDIVRCKFCKSYINPFVNFQDSGSNWRCNLCKCLNPVDARYFAPLDEKGIRTDLNKRVELQYCSYDIIAPESYMYRPPMPAVFFFVVDISHKSKDLGYLDCILDAISGIVEESYMPGMPRTLVGLIAFDTAVHFISFGENGPSVVTVAEKHDEMFLPVPRESLLVSLEDNSDKFLQGIDLLRSMPSFPISTAYRCALRASYLVLHNQGGKNLVFVAENHSESGHPKEFSLNATLPFFKDFATEMSQVNVSCDVFICSSQYSNVLSLGEVAKYTGGEVFYYPNFTRKQVGEKLENEIWMVITRKTVWEAAMRLRVSKDWKATHVYGHFVIRSGDLLCLPNFNESQTVTYDFKLENMITEDDYFYLQAALLYTSNEGERRIRVHNLRTPYTDQVRNIYEYANNDTLVAIISKKALSEMARQSKLEVGRNYIEARCREVVSSCAGNVPRSLNFFVLSCLGAMKHPLFVNQSLGCK